MKKIFLTIIVLSFTGLLFAQDSTKVWTKGGSVGLNFSQVGFYNWAKGGDNSLSGNSFLKLFANRNKNGWSWENKLDFEYGLKQNQDENLKKTDDRIEFDTKIGRKANEEWYYTGFLNFKTQFTEGFDYGSSDVVYISNIMAPGFISAGLGMDYKPNAYFSAMISPASSKTTLVLDERLADEGAFGVDPAEYDASGIKTVDGKTVREEIGATMTLTYKKDIFTNVNLDTKLDLFSNYLNHPQNIDVDWQVTLTMKVNKYLNAVVKTHLIYDDDQNINWQKDGVMHNSPITQFKQSIAVGLMYSF